MSQTCFIKRLVVHTIEIHRTAYLIKSGTLEDFEPKEQTMVVFFRLTHHFVSLLFIHLKISRSPSSANIILK